MQLLERESQLKVLGDALIQVRKSGGCIALVYGEAGSGKTSLVEQFITNRTCPEPEIVRSRWTEKCGFPRWQPQRLAVDSFLELMEGVQSMVATFAASENIGKLRATLHGEVFLQEDAGYEPSQRVWNRAINRCHIRMPSIITSGTA